MAQNFRRLLLRNVGTAAADLPDGSNFPTGFHTVVGINLSNTSDNMILADVYLNDGSNDHYIVKEASIPSGSSINIDGKFVVASGDRLWFKSDTNSTLDVIVSYVQEIST